MPSKTKFEIERKWLLERLPGFPIRESHVVHQAYLYVDDNIEIRLICRFDADAYNSMCPVCNKRKLTIKFGNGLVRAEAEIKLTEEQFAELQRFIQYPYIVKYFKIFELPDGSEFECSVVDPGTDTSFTYAEIEFDNENAAHCYRMPHYLGDCISTEVTGDPKYQMKNYWRRTRMDNPGEQSASDAAQRPQSP